MRQGSQVYIHTFSSAIEDDYMFTRPARKDLVSFALNNQLKATRHKSA